ncbi:DUF4157 domain-containing protein [Isoptericola jiangsuensis]|uniref:eCIS core domain-containing protein n=1 Tax=Isoptericola jiangsuensis TaxID=548579 RepID=UPI003AAB357F
MSRTDRPSATTQLRDDRPPTAAGERLPAATAAHYGALFGHDFSAVRVHTDARSGARAAGMGALAFTAGRDVHFAPGRFAPHTPDGRRLLAHELAHVVQQDDATPSTAVPDRSGERAAHAAADRVTAGGRVQVGRRDARGPQLQEEPSGPGAGLGVTFNAAMSAADWPTAVRALEEMPASVVGGVLAAVNAEGLERLRAASLELDPAGSARSSRAIAAAQGAAAVPAPPSPQRGSTDVAALDAVDKLGRAWDYARPEIGPAVQREVDALFSPQALFIMAAFAALAIASHLTPAGWVADAFVLTMLSLTVVFVGMAVLEIAHDILRYFGAVVATTDHELRQAGSALARALARGGVAIFIALLSRGVPRGAGRGPRPSAPAELVPVGPGAVSWPVRAAVVTDVPATVPLASRFASYAVMMPPGATAAPSTTSTTGGGSGRGGGTGRGGGGHGRAPGPARGPEIWAEITAELSLDPPRTGARGGIRGAVQDAIEAGLVDESGRPGTVDLAVQPYSSAPTVRAATGTTGARTNAAHVAPTAFMRGQPGYSRSGALTTGLDPLSHALFDG